jgi:hypothetical protein
LDFVGIRSPPVFSGLIHVPLQAKQSLMVIIVL